MSKYTWQDDARCAETDPELFFGKDNKNHSSSAAALKICSGCPVIDACLAAAMREERGQYPRYGIRGGLRPKQRQALAKALQR